MRKYAKSCIIYTKIREEKVTMKRFFALTLTLTLMLFCSCSKKETRADIAVLPEDLAVSLALTYNTSAWQKPIDVSDQMFFWQTVGWYTVYTGRIAGTDNVSITKSDAEALRQIIAPDSDIPFPTDFPYGDATADGYNFNGTKTYSDSYIGIIAEIYSEQTVGFGYIITFIEHYDNGETENSYRIIFSGNTEDFRLESIEWLEPATFASVDNLSIAEQHG